MMIPIMSVYVKMIVINVCSLVLIIHMRNFMILCLKWYEHMKNNMNVMKLFEYACFDLFGL